MAFEDFLRVWSNNIFIPLFYSVSLILSTLLGWLFSRFRGGEAFPWNYFYTFLVYSSVIPGIFAINIFLYDLIEGNANGPVKNFSLLIPIFTMIIVLWLIQFNVSFKKIPGFNQLKSFLGYVFVLIFVFMGIEVLFDIGISGLPFIQVVLGFALVLLVLRVLTKRKLSK
ncbi:hypothetical protein [Membranihabitans maritimus]|uniref:hypothetical protein n=1 Tax=Membranihabitans maritimus TaxID=2904244 RepID=UPI001F167B86|nr:hypothetical protein [Membranihabitans maritimus]